ncbi:protein ZINC INDUCED FACILITATOR-LIKE 1 isoform X2 [Sorghum bicolor]|uniref:protein ZINC INDUCED FACILITATOR-LIKE 1 isoform X2 n=1 Tax=Sorghum bicolor TaxID=4558 RepID=UPI00081AE691|nr:protein ZINC INDUCED FACILITATOR-LIKE 1 isoform X2 [Sorghum bicolor]|eukprot:XP_021316602.1 protein ZINC INDUCED FACILITATOR-LIKE 1 isoform X2 [Sorghum bicolor]
MAGGSSEGEAAAVPLLEEEDQEQPTAVYFDGCPGCIIDREKAENTGIPYWRFFHIWIINLVVCLPISSIFPFIYFMIRDLHVAKRVEDIGFYAGFIGASLMLGRALTSTIWGMVADRIGRKPVIVFGIFTTLVFNTLFGLSVHYWMAVATRFLLGSLNGLLGTLRAYAVEVSRPEHHAIGLSLISTSWAIGLILGPSIGGYLAQPTEKYPKLFPANSLFGRFPYFLPCLCITVFCLGILFSCVWLQETLHTHKLEKEEDQATKTINGHLAGDEENVEQHITLTMNKNLFQNWPLISSIVLFCIAAFDDMTYMELFPLWAESDRSYGGLSLLSEDVGQVFAITGFWLPIVLNVASALKANFVVTLITCSLILQNNSVTQDQRATANGLATTLMSFSKALAPIGGGIVFSWVQKRQHAFFFPGDQMLFFLMDLIMFMALIWTFKPFLSLPEQLSSS